MTKKVRLRTDRIIIVVAVLVAVIVGIFGILRDHKLQNNEEYKLERIGYKENEVKDILKYTDEKQLEVILSLEYNEAIPELLKQKYFKFDFLKRYLNYFKENEKTKISEIVRTVNVNGDYEPYSHTEKADLSKNYTVLVNKYYHLEKDYKPEDLVPCALMYAYDNNQLREEAYEAFKRLFNAAQKEGYTIIINASYRSYEAQGKLYQNYKVSYGQKYADTVASRAGFSERQTGLSIDVSKVNSSLAKFEETDEFKWMKENAYKFGFILRYPKGKEKITGYEYEPWHYRYVGIDIANEIHKLDITFDEYYAYYLK